MGLKVFIVGAGIGGLVTSIALQKAGHEVTIFERSHFKNEIGAAITITPNGARILDRLGFDFEKAGMITAQHVTFANGATLEPFDQRSFAVLKEKYGYGIGFYHRVDLHQELKREAEHLGVVIKLGHHVEEVNPNGTIKIKDQAEIMTADLVIVADGIHSTHLQTITGKPEPLIDSGQSAIRALIPQSKIRSDPTLAPIFGQQTPGWYVPMFPPPHLATFVTYPCRNNEVLNIAMIRHNQPAPPQQSDWNHPISLASAQASIQPFHPACHTLLSLADSLAVHGQPRRAPLHTFTNTHLLTIGDAAHLMPPTHAQGAVATLEEAIALSILLPSTPSKLPTRLNLYESLVKPRMHTVQLLSYAVPGQHNEFRQQAERIWEQAGRGELYPDTEGFYSERMMEFFYSWDMGREAERVLKDEAGC